MAKTHLQRWNEIIDTVGQSGHIYAYNVATKLRDYWTPLHANDQYNFSEALSLGWWYKVWHDPDINRRRLKRAIMALRLATESMTYRQLATELRRLHVLNLANVFNDLITRIANDYFPAMQVDNTWGGNVNCYAYAMNCHHPGGNPGKQAIPGIHGGHPYPYFHGDRDNLVAGALADNAQPVVGNLNPPFIAPPGGYLVALFVGGGGFHWIRRDNNRRWSWKEGNAVPVQLSVAARSTDQDEIIFTKMHRYVTDDMIPDLVRNKYAPWPHNNKQFERLFSVQIVGLQVDAPP